MSVEWQAPPAELQLPKRQLHIWRISLDRDDDTVDELEMMLSEREASRADRYLFSKQRRNYIIVRGALRKISGQYTNEEPALIEFEYNGFGKPFLADANLNFCTAQTENYALLAFVCSAKIGVEIRKWDKELNVGAIIDENFSATEQAQYAELPNELKHKSFYKGLVSKEAFLKALGRGQHLEMTHFDVDIDPRTEMQLLAINEEEAAAKSWTMHDLSSSDDCNVAVACEKSHKAKFFVYE